MVDKRPPMMKEKKILQNPTNLIRMTRNVNKAATAAYVKGRNR
jgi:hypothetical protein